jgi:hypothetical protein
LPEDGAGANFGPPISSGEAITQVDQCTSRRLTAEHARSRKILVL